MQQQESKPETTSTSSSAFAAPHVGQAVLLLRRRAGDEVSGLRWRKMLQVADALEGILPLVETLEAR